MNSFKVLWLGFAVPDSIARELFALDPLPAIQTHKFGWSFARALRRSFGEVTLASSCPVQNYPLTRRLVFYGSGFTFQGMSGRLLGFVNLMLLKHLTRLTACIITVAPLVRRKSIDWIFIHGVHTPYLIFGLLSRLAGCRIAVVLTDPPGVVLPTDGRVARLMKGVDAWLVKKILSCANAVIALAPDLVRQLAPERPSLVFPGILESTLDSGGVMPFDRKRASLDTKPFTIVYAGGLTKSYGVDRLIDAILSFDARIAVQLRLFGRGDQEERARQLAASDSRIYYGGFVDTESLLPELFDADLLINPRPNNELFSSLSFPSKLIEYLATGRPVLTTRIVSIPDPLKPYYYFINDESPHGIRLAIESVMQVPVSERTSRALAAQKYVRTQLSEEATGRRIADFLLSLPQ